MISTIFSSCRNLTIRNTDVTSLKALLASFISLPKCTYSRNKLFHKLECWAITLKYFIEQQEERFLNHTLTLNRLKVFSRWWWQRSYRVPSVGPPVWVEFWGEAKGHHQLPQVGWKVTDTSADHITPSSAAVRDTVVHLPHSSIFKGSVYVFFLSRHSHLSSPLFLTDSIVFFAKFWGTYWFLHYVLNTVYEVLLHFWNHRAYVKIMTASSPK